MIKVSFIIGTYNGSIKLHRMISSILNQSYKNYEIIICDDFSNDDTFDILIDYKNKYPNLFKIIKNEKSLKLAESLNKCLKIAEGEYIARIDDDDLCYEDRLIKQVRFLDENSNIDCIGSYMDVFDGDNIKTERKVILNPNLKSLLKGGYPFHHPTIMIRKTVLNALGGYRSLPETNRCEDLDLWYRFFIEGFKGANLDIPLIRYNESVEDYNKRKISNLITAVKLRIYYRKKLKANPMYDLIYLKTLVMALLPNRFRHYIKSKFKY